MRKYHSPLFAIFFSDRFSIKFILGVIVGLGFSISIILATIGIMDGFTLSLRKGLKSASGDISIHLKDRFFTHDQKIKDKLLNLDVKESTPVLQMEGFAIKNEVSKGILLRGVDSSYQQISGLNFTLKGRDIAVGKELASSLNIKIGDEIALALGSASSAATLSIYQVSSIVEHGVYEKDSRLIYVSLDYLQSLFQMDGKINLLLLNVPPHYEKKNKERVESFIEKLQEVFIQDYRIKPYWYDYSGLIKAVEVEKVMIGLILQVIVVISVFNLVAFIYYLNERKSKEIFLIKALGLAQQHLSVVWNTIIILIWLAASFLSLFLVFTYNYALNHLDFLKLPGDIYQLSAIHISLETWDYLLVFSLSLLWIILINFVALYSIKRKPIVSALRREFS